MIDLEWIRKVVELVDASGIDSLEISRWGTRIRLSKSPPVNVVPGGAVAPPVPSSPGHASSPSETPAPERVPDVAEEEAVAGSLVEVQSPMVGTFYRAPAPDAPPYVEIGDRVSKGQTLCILEAMKLMNELESEVSGTLREIAVENAEPVEFGQVLFRIEPD